MELLIHTPCDVAWKQEANSASIVQAETKFCVILLHEIAPSTIIKVYLDIDLREYTAEEVIIWVAGYIQIVRLSIHERVTPAPWNYLNTFFAAFQWSISGLSWYLSKVPTPNAMEAELNIITLPELDGKIRINRNN
jgi:hypothetical protein